jgi:hypothetical protein
LKVWVLDRVFVKEKSSEGSPPVLLRAEPARTWVFAALST